MRPWKGNALSKPSPLGSVDSLSDDRMMSDLGVLSPLSADEWSSTLHIFSESKHTASFDDDSDSGGSVGSARESSKALDSEYSGAEEEDTESNATMLVTIDKSPSTPVVSPIDDETTRSDREDRGRDRCS